MKESKSNWSCVAEELMQEVPEVNLGRYASFWFHKTPRRVLHCMSYYKFASKLIGKGRRVLDVGCNEGLGTFLVGKECGFAKGVDFDEDAITQAQKNFKEPFVEFETGDFLKNEDTGNWDAVINFDVIEHILPEHAHDFIEGIAKELTPEGLCVIGTPSKISQDFASEVSKKGHINIYSHERLEAEMREHFEFVFMFAANDEVVHTGYLPLAHYFITVGCKKKS
ncbi:class I SAM-dependent methyltransferase [Candidatus Neptunichlamydia sp. REUL1]|uniref:class I SAM-dependent methyltransferase n=1 Tax=Candidatus Neptunichlamydia sp. REUL1 TaxID=3064277 RepID=UPI00292F4374|nr:class I SAM-dependent methyltransferase [Candidatus Neptunochlamydia sp. REUL1]